MIMVAMSKINGILKKQLEMFYKKKIIKKMYNIFGNMI